ncbi:MAG: PAS domain S-box protein, partial [Nitrospiraceae bacterium]|nr:PAS domain S-box protein [Nitrospiraceae bacterium]
MKKRRSTPKSRKGERVAHYETIRRRKDGTEIPISLTISPVTNAAGKVIGASKIARDITERRRSEEALRESEQRFSALFNQVTTGIAQTDLTGRFVLVNQRYCDIVGRASDELLQLRMQDITHPDDLPGNLAQFQQLTTEGSSFEVEKRYIRPDGSVVWVANSVSMVQDAEARPKYIVALTQDITARRQAE